MYQFTLDNILQATKNRRPDFNNLLSVLKCEKPSRPTLFEFFLNGELEDYIIKAATPCADFSERIVRKVAAFRAVGYDYVTLSISDFRFESNSVESKETCSLNDGNIITDIESFEKYPWPNPADLGLEYLEKAAPLLEDGMKIMVSSAGGVLENVIALFGYDNLCYALADNQQLVEKMFEAVGSRLAQYYEMAAGLPYVGVLMSNDDWGFNTQTMLSAEDLRKYVFPWHKKIVQAAKKHNKPAILHSCGNSTQIDADIIESIGFSGKHSYEDNICPVEEKYFDYKSKIAVLGGIDLDFMCRSTPQQVFERARNMIELSDGCTGFALGSGNSIPPFIPRENYFAMIAAALFE